MISHTQIKNLLGTTSNHLNEIELDQIRTLLLELASIEYHSFCSQKNAGNVPSDAEISPNASKN
jgi:hypothetical protein